ncbi:gp24 [Enterobacter hormaechei]|nr:gp24 [Enterobacter hormaechei]
MTLQSFTEVIDAKLRYPNTALLYIEFDSSQFNGSIPQISCEPRGRVIRVPDTYDPETRSYSGTWTGAFKWAWTDNPAWIFYDLVVSDRFGLGHRLTAANIDKWTLYQVAQYCDQMVPDGKGGDGTEPRYTCNVYIQDRNDAYTVLRDFAAIFRGMTYWGGDQIVALADMPRDVDYSYTRANVVGGRFTYSSSTTKTRYTTALVSWSDPGNAYADAMEPVFEQALVARYGFNQLEMTAIGCTRQSEANRKGRWGILTNNKDRVVSFDVGLDGNIPQPGYIIAVADELLSGKVMGGRISAVNGRVIKLDRVADAAAGDRLILNLPSGASQSRTIQAVNGESVTVTTAYSETPQAEAVWVVESNELYAQQYRVVSVTDNDDGTFTITGAWHDPDKYARIDTGAIIDQRPVSVIPPGNQSPPANIVISSFSVVQQNISVETMRVSWDQAQNAIAYEAQWRRNDGNWVNVPRSSTTSFDVPGIYAGRYLVRVRAINAAEISSGWGYSEEKTLTGKVGNPPKPVGFIASDNVVFGIELSWGFPANTDDTLKTEIQYSLTGTEDDAMLLADVPYPQRKYQQMGLKAGQIFWYRAQLVDRSGNESGYTDWVRGQASIDVSDITDVILEEIKDSEIFKDLIESAVESSEKLAELSDAIKENADGLAAAVGSNKQTAEAIIGNALAIADVVVRQTAQQGANSATFEQLREVIATETEARVTDVTRLEAKTAQNEAGVTEVRQALSDEAQARATAVDQLTASTQVISDKADSASSKADAASGKADAAEQASSQNTADITTLRQVVTDTTSSMASRLEELGARTDTASGGIQSNSIALITSTLAQVDQQVRLSAQYSDSKASIDRIDNVMASDREATARSLLSVQAEVNGNKASINSLNQTFSNYQQATATQINGITATINGHTSAITTNAQAIANVNGDLNAMYSIKVAVDANGKQYAAGMGIGVQNTPSGMQSQVLFLADRFAVMAQAGGAVSLPFVIQNGQTFINDAFFRDASIQFGKITDSLKSDNFVSGSSGAGWNLPKSGNAELNNVTIRGMVYASGGSFKGTVEATSFVGDVANVGVGSDASLSGTANLVKTITYTDSGSSSLAKNALVEATFYSSANADTSMNVIIDINGTSKTFSNLPVQSGAYANNFYTLRFGVKGINTNTVKATLTIVNANSVSKIIYSPSLIITRGTGSFVG